MTITTVNITGTVTPPNDTAVAGTVRFVLSGFDLDTATNLVAPREVSAPVAADGSFTAPVWPPQRGLYDRTYTVYLEYPPARPGAYPDVTVLATGVTFPDGASSYTLGGILIGLPSAIPEELIYTAWAAELTAATEFYASAAQGVAAVSDGDYFFVSALGKYIELWRRVSGSPIPVTIIAPE